MCYNLAPLSHLKAALIEKSNVTGGVNCHWIHSGLLLVYHPWTRFRICRGQSCDFLGGRDKQVSSNALKAQEKSLLSLTELVQQATGWVPVLCINKLE